MRLAMQLIWWVDATNNMLPHGNTRNYFKYGFIADYKNWAVKCNSSQSIHMATTWIFQLLKVCFNLEIFCSFKFGDRDCATWHYVLSSSFSRSSGQTWSMWFLIHQIYCGHMANFGDFTHLFSCKCVMIWIVNLNIF